MYNVSITRLRVRSIFYMPLFILHAMRTITQAQKADGVQGVETRFEKNNVVWTKTVWTDEATMKKYRGSGAHQVAMRILSAMRQLWRAGNKPMRNCQAGKKRINACCEKANCPRSSIRHPCRQLA
jgi:hypothetical protein